MNCPNKMWAWGMIRVCELPRDHAGDCSWFPPPPSFDKHGNRLNPDGSLYDLDRRLRMYNGGEE